MNTKNIRNFGILAHVNAGKTTTTERLLYLTRAIKYTGNVDEGTTTTDFMYEERERGITIQSACVQCNWNGTTFQLIDTPGHIDFTLEVERCLHVLDATLIVLCGQSGFQAQTENVFRMVKSSQKPLIFYINKLDKESANFERVLDEINIREKTIVLSAPLYQDEKLLGVVDVLTGEFESVDKNDAEIPLDATLIAEYYKSEMLETLSEFDDKLLETMLEGAPTNSQIKESIRKLTIERKVTPVLAGASKINLGIKNIANAIKEYFPSPNEVTESYFSDNKEHIDTLPDSIGYCFKNIFDSSLGELEYIKVNRGQVHVGDTLQSSEGNSYNVKTIYLPFAQLYESIDKLSSGEIGLLKLEGVNETQPQVRTGDTLFSSNYNGNISLEQLSIPKPVIFAKIEFNNIDDQTKFHEIKKHLLLEDPSLSFMENITTGQMLIGGMGELHLEIFRERMQNSYGVKLLFGKPDIIINTRIKEHFTKTVSASLTFEGNPIEFTAIIKGKPNVKRVIINDTDYPNVSQIIDSNSETIDEYQLIETKLEILNLECSMKTPPDGLVYLAVSRMIQEAIKEMNLVLVEPIMVLEILTTPEYTGNVTADIMSKKGVISDISRVDQFDKVTAKIPMRELFGYATNLRSITAGHSSFSIQLSNYEECEF